MRGPTLFKTVRRPRRHHGHDDRMPEWGGNSTSGGGGAPRRGSQRLDRHDLDQSGPARSWTVCRRAWRRWRSSAGITVKWPEIDNINQVIMTKIQANDTPDIAFIPQPGVVADIVSRNGDRRSTTSLDMSSLKSSMIPGTLEAGTVNGKLYGLLVSANTKSFVFYPKKAWDSGRLQGAHDDRRARTR